MRVIALFVSIVIFAGMIAYTMAQAQMGASPPGGRALDLVGRDAAVADDNDTLDRELEDDFTIEAWIYIPKLPECDDQWTIVSKPGSYEWFIVGAKHKFAGAGSRPQGYCFAFNIQPGPGHKGITYCMGPGEIKGDITKRWHHIAIMTDQVRFRWTFDGKELSGGPFCAVPDSDSEFYVGGNPDRPGSFFKGSIDELRISKIRRYMQIPFELPEGGFEADQDAMGLWHFDESGRIFQDAADGNMLLLRRGGLSVDSSGKLAARWGAIKHWMLPWNH